MDYFSILNTFLITAPVCKVPASSRFIFMIILAKWNLLKRPAKFTLPDDDLKYLSGMGSNAITHAKRQLKNLGYINFVSTKKGTIYTFRDCEKFHGVRNGVMSNAQTGQAGFIKTTQTKIIERKEVTKRAHEDFESFEF